MNHTLFISDLHLDASHPQTTALFLNFLEKAASKADALYILGDLFEAWIGDDFSDEFTKTIKEALKKLVKNIPIYFMPGNRDFLLGKRFAKETGCQLLNDPTVINLYGTSILLMHGDSLCIQDKRHQQFRKFSQHPLIKNIFLSFPLFFRKYMANRLRQISKKHTKHLNYQIMDVSKEAVIKNINKHNAELLIHGHTHLPAIHDISIEEKNIKRIVLGAWHDNEAKILLIKSSGEFELITYKTLSN